MNCRMFYFEDDNRKISIYVFGVIEIGQCKEYIAFYWVREKGKKDNLTIADFYESLVRGSGFRECSDTDDCKIDCMVKFSEYRQNPFFELDFEKLRGKIIDGFNKRFNNYMKQVGHK